MTSAKREQLIREAIARVGGYANIRPGSWGVIPFDSKGTYELQERCGRKCCPLGATILGGKFGVMWGSASECAAERLQVSTRWVDSFTAAFDQQNDTDDPWYDPEGVAMGMMFRAEYDKETEKK